MSPVATAGLGLVLTRHGRSVTDMAYAPNGKLLATSGSDETVRLWDTATGAGQAVPTGRAGTVHAPAFAPDSQMPAASGDNGTVQLWNPTTGSERGTLTRHGHCHTRSPSHRKASSSLLRAPTGP